ncbi:MAG: membrane dipeptidase [Rikenellaceae bacterium]
MNKLSIFNFEQGFYGDDLAMSGVKPLIALSANIIDENSALHAAYTQAIIEAGGLPLIIPFNCNAQQLRSVIASVDGVLLTGGGDIEASYFGEENLEGGITDLNPQRDCHEMALIRAALDRGVPILGICRGFQLLNIAFGGDIYQDLPSMYQGELLNHSILEPRERGVHEIEVERGTLLEQILGCDRISVNSRHHQGVRRIAPGFRVSARSGDALVEAIESCSTKRIIAVQWHPENMATKGECQAMRRLFNYLIDEAKLRMVARRIHAQNPIIDSHCDTPMLYDKGGFDFSRRSREAKLDLVKMSEGEVDSAVVVAYIPQSTPAPERKAMTLNILKRFSLDVEQCDGVVQVRSARELLDAKLNGLRSVMLGVENGAGLGGDISMVSTLRDMGVIYVTLCHNGTNDICDSARGEALHDGVSEFGREVIHRLNEEGILVDVSHSSEKSTLDAVKLSGKPVIASHSSCKALCNHPRNLSDECIVAIAQSGGVVQICGYGGFLAEGREATLYDLVEHIEYAVSLVGYEHVGVGSDFDGDGGVEGFDGANEFMNVTVELLRRGHSAVDVAKIMGGNILRVIEARL